jgi:hypothetical protein
MLKIAAPVASRTTTDQGLLLTQMPTCFGYADHDGPMVRGAASRACYARDARQSMRAGHSVAHRAA